MIYFNRIEGLIGVSIGLVGCIKKLKIGRKEVDLRYPLSRDIKNADNIGKIFPHVNAKLLSMFFVVIGYLG